VPLLKREPEIWPPDLFETGPATGEGLGEGDASLAPDGVAPRNEQVKNGHNGPGLVAASDAAAKGGVTGPAGRWWVAYTRSRQEKGLARHLLYAQVAYYLPQREHRFRAGDRTRTSHVPLFTGYVFFRGDLHDRTTALRSNLVVNLIDPLDQEQLARELRSLWILQTTGEPLVPHPYLAPGDEVEVTEGALRGYRGIVLREKGKVRLVVSITLLRQSVAVELDREVLHPTGAGRERHAGVERGHGGAAPLRGAAHGNGIRAGQLP
jgi:transcription antitermination factor NusG